MCTKMIYCAEVEDPVTGEVLVFEGENETELDTLIDRHFSVPEVQSDTSAALDGPSATCLSQST